MLHNCPYLAECHSVTSRIVLFASWFSSFWRRISWDTWHRFVCIRRGFKKTEVRVTSRDSCLPILISCAQPWYCSGEYLLPCLDWSCDMMVLASLKASLHTSHASMMKLYAHCSGVWFFLSLLAPSPFFSSTINFIHISNIVVFNNPVLTTF